MKTRPESPITVHAAFNGTVADTVRLAPTEKHKGMIDSEMICVTDNTSEVKFSIVKHIVPATGGLTLHSVATEMHVGGAGEGDAILERFLNFFYFCTHEIRWMTNLR